MPRRLAQKLILSLTIIVVIIAAVSGLITVRNQERQLLDAMILGADQLSHGIASATWNAMLANHRESAYSVMQTIAQQQGIDRVRIYNRDCRIIFSTEDPSRRRISETSSADAAVCGASVAQSASADAHLRSRIYRSSDGHRSLTMLTAIPNERSCSRAACHSHPTSEKVLGFLDVGLSLSPVDKEVAEMQRHVFVVTGIQILLISVFIFFFTRYFVGAPIDQLIQATKAISAMELDEPIVVRHWGSEEIDELVNSFNGMRTKLRSAMAELNQFTETLEAKVSERTEQLEAAHQKLLQSDRLASLGQLAASVAHEINNPISGVLNLAMLMQRVLQDDGIPNSRVADFRKYLSQVINETTRVGRIVSDLLSFSRRSKPQRVPSDLNKIVRSTLSLIAHKFKLMNVEVETKLSEELPLTACDSSQIQQVVLNLLMNAAEATQAKGQGRISIATRVAPDRRSAILVVADTGEGIAPENLSKIFDPFFTTKPEGKGVGLGLAVMYGIIEAHGGEIDVKSKPGEGATFTITLPLTAAEKPNRVVLPMTAGIGQSGISRT
jgi:two-component system, NtrC family, sensor kinase